MAEDNIVRREGEKMVEADRNDVAEDGEECEEKFERLTYIDGDGWFAVGENGEQVRGEYIDRLAQYEDTGESPDKIDGDKKLMAYLASSASYAKFRLKQEQRRRRGRFRW